MWISHFRKKPDFFDTDSIFHKFITSPKKFEVYLVKYVFQLKVLDKTI